MDIIEDFLRYRQLTYLRLDGTTRPEERSRLLAEFNKPDSPYFMFILSTRAGGLGLNLQSADTVIIYDSDWNPHQDLQAQDRAHRIGQTLEVRILRLITEKSVEEKILEIAHRKLDMDGKVIQAGKFDNNASNEERDTLLRAMLESAGDEEEGGDATIGDDELNQIIARSDEEQVLFARMDADRRVEDQKWWTHTDHKGSFPADRMISETELPDMFRAGFEEKILAAQQAEQEKMLQEVPASRRTRNVTIRYNDDLTEDQFLQALENEQDPEEIAAAKRARSEKRRANAAARANASISDDDDGSALAPPKRCRGRPAKGPRSTPTPEPRRRAREESDDEFPAVSRKRRRATPSDSGASPAPTFTGVSNANPRKKKSGSSSGNPDLARRDAVSQALLPCYQAVEELTDPETGRRRCLLFVDLPNKHEYPDYRVLIRHPICLRTIKRRLDRRLYRDAATCKGEVRLMCENARTYNQEGSFVWHDANFMEQAFNEVYEQSVDPTLRGDEPDQAPILNPARGDLDPPPAPPPAPATPGVPSQSQSDFSSDGTASGAKLGARPSFEQGLESGGAGAGAGAGAGSPDGQARSSGPTTTTSASSNAATTTSGGLPRIPRRSGPDEPASTYVGAHPLAREREEGEAD